MNDFGYRKFNEDLYEFSTSHDASQCMDAERQVMTKPGGQYAPLDFPKLGDDSVATTGLAIPSRPTSGLHHVFVRRANVVLHIGGPADDRTLSYVNVALAKLDRVLASATPASQLAMTPTP